jgi:hypothetical protein
MKNFSVSRHQSMSSMQGRPHVESLRAAIRSSKLPVDEDGATGILAAREFWVGRDQPIDHGLDGGAFLGAEKLPTAGRTGDSTKSRSSAGLAPRPTEVPNRSATADLASPGGA